MQKIRTASIIGTGMSVPDNVVTNADLEKIIDTSNEWIVQRSGIKERRHVVPGEGPASLAEAASRKALQAAGLKPEDLDLIIVATLSPEHFFPGTSCILQSRLGCQTIPAFDVRAQCSGFIYGLNIAQQFISSGQYDRILVCGTEVHSRALDMTTRGRDMAVLFGDGAGAVILEACKIPEHGIISTILHSDGQFADKLWVEAPSMSQTPHISAEMIEQGKIYPKMDGKFVFKNAVTRMPEAVWEVLNQNYLQPQDVDLFLFHQANLRINEHVGQQLGLRASQVYNNIEKYGNCSAASIPILLDECVRSGRIKSGNLVCMTAFGSGFTWASSLIRW